MLEAIILAGIQGYTLLQFSRVDLYQHRICTLYFIFFHTCNKFCFQIEVTEKTE